MAIEKAADLLRSAGLKRTPGRLAMLGVLLRSRRPLTPQEILRRVAAIGLNRVSVYRGLHAFAKAGIVHRIEAGDRMWRFAVCEHGTHSIHCHPHFTCRACGKVECLSAARLPRVREPLPGYMVEEQEVYMKGVCGDCSKEG